MLRSYLHLFLTTCCSLLKGTQCFAGKLWTRKQRVMRVTNVTSDQCHCWKQEPGQVGSHGWLLGLCKCRGGSEAPAEQRGSPDLFFLPPARWLPQHLLAKAVPVSELYSSRRMEKKSRSFGYFVWLGEWDLAGLLHCHLIFPLPELNWGNGRRVFLGCFLVLKELISVETFKFYAFQGVPHSFWKWELSALQTVFHRVRASR